MAHLWHHGGGMTAERDARAGRWNDAGRLHMLAALATLSVAAPVHAGGSQDGPTYYRDVLPIMQEHCQGCHRPSGQNLTGLIAPMSFMDYRETRPWARAVARKVQAREMPPWFASAPQGVFSNERGLTDGEVDTLVSWVEAGAPAGDLADAPPARDWTNETNDGWMHGTPDFVVKMPRPYLVEDDVYDLNISFYTRLTEADLPEDVWVRGTELRVGDNRITHHMCVWVYPPSEQVRADGSRVEDGAAVEGEGATSDVDGSIRLSCAAQGSESGMLPDGYGIPIEKGSLIGFHMHYYKEPGRGTAVTSQAEIGFFVSREPAQYAVRTEEIFNRGFQIPPNHPRYRVGSSRVLEHDTHVVSLWPHTHKRGTAARYTAIYPDGTEELLLDVPNYDQGWQITYKYEEPKVLPRGTRIEFDSWYDNTPERAARQDFDSNRFVGHGPKTNDEMSLGFFSFAEAGTP